MVLWIQSEPEFTDFYWINLIVSSAFDRLSSCWRLQENIFDIFSEVLSWPSLVVISLVSAERRSERKTNDTAGLSKYKFCSLFVFCLLRIRCILFSFFSLHGEHLVDPYRSVDSGMNHLTLQHLRMISVVTHENVVTHNKFLMAFMILWMPSAIIHKWTLWNMNKESLSSLNRWLRNFFNFTTRDIVRMKRISGVSFKSKHISQINYSSRWWLDNYNNNCLVN